VSAKRNSGFLSIGGFKLYTQDISDDENEEYKEDLSDEESSRLSENNDSECTSDNDSNIDEDVVEDYLEGVGGSDNILDAKWLLKPGMNKVDDDSSSINIGIDKGDSPLNCYLFYSNFILRFIFYFIILKILKIYESRYL